MATSTRLDAAVAGTVLAFQRRKAPEHLMDGLNHTGRQPTEFSELTAGGLILWRLTTAGQPDLWCLAFELPEGLAFVLEDHPEGSQPARITEQHADIVTLVNRAEMLKLSLLRSGWTEVDVE
jgi:hypothetical protein